MLPGRPDEVPPKHPVTPRALSGLTLSLRRPTNGLPADRFTEFQQSCDVILKRRKHPGGIWPAMALIKPLCPSSSHQNPSHDLPFSNLQGTVNFKPVLFPVRWPKGSSVMRLRPVLYRRSPAAPKRGTGLWSTPLLRPLVQKKNPTTQRRLFRCRKDNGIWGVGTWALRAPQSTSRERQRTCRPTVVLLTDVLTQQLSNSGYRSLLAKWVWQDFGV